MKPNEELLPQEQQTAEGAQAQEAIEQPEPAKEETEVSQSDKDLTRDE